MPGGGNRFTVRKDDVTGACLLSTLLQPAHPASSPGPPGRCPHACVCTCRAVRCFARFEVAPAHDRASCGMNGNPLLAQRPEVLPGAPGVLAGRLALGRVRRGPRAIMAAEGCRSVRCGGQPADGRRRRLRPAQRAGACGVQGSGQVVPTPPPPSPPTAKQPIEPTFWPAVAPSSPHKPGSAVFRGGRDTRSIKPRSLHCSGSVERTNHLDGRVAGDAKLTDEQIPASG